MRNTSFTGTGTSGCKRTLLSHGANREGTLRLTFMSLAVALALGSGPVWADRVDNCRAALEGNAKQLERSETRLKAIYERQGHTAEKIESATERLLKNTDGDYTKSIFVRDILHGFNDAHQAFYDLGEAWLDREVLLKNLGKLAVECMS